MLRKVKLFVRLADGTEDEPSRIRAAYARRQGTVDKWSYSYFDKGNLIRVQELERSVLNLLRRHGRQELGNQQILEVGCGTGSWVREFIKWGARPKNLVGLDLLPERIAEARQLCPSTVSFYCESATTLRFPDRTFDLVLQSTVFSSIFDRRTKAHMAAEMLRVLKPDGLILWYDLLVNNPWNPDVRGVARMEISQLFPECRIDLRRISLAPPVARLVAPYSRTVCHLLGRFPFFCAHYLGAIGRLWTGRAS